MKQAAEVDFYKKSNATDCLDLVFNNNIVRKALPQKHFGLILDDKINLKEHIEKTPCKTKKGIEILRKLYFIPRSPLLTLYKTFVRTDLDYGDVIYDQPSNASFSDKIESAQYDGALVLPGHKRGQRE